METLALILIYIVMFLVALLLAFVVSSISTYIASKTNLLIGFVSSVALGFVAGYIYAPLCMLAIYAIVSPELYMLMIVYGIYKQGIPLAKRLYKWIKAPVINQSAIA